MILRVLLNFVGKNGPRLRGVYIITVIGDAPRISDLQEIR